MDPLTHVVVGRAVIAAVLGALAPDVDVPVALAGWDRYLLRS